jgi:hypothetical protein
VLEIIIVQYSLFKGLLRRYAPISEAIEKNDILEYVKKQKTLQKNAVLNKKYYLCSVF